MHNNPASLGSLRLSMNENGDLEVTGWSSYIEYKHITKGIALKELSEIKKEFELLLTQYMELEKLINGKPISFNLWFDDNSKGSISECSERHGRIHWGA